MSDDRFEERTAPQWRKFKDVAETAFDRAQRAKFENGDDDEPVSGCAACSNSGVEQFKDADGYNVARRCTECRPHF